MPRLKQPPGQHIRREKIISKATRSDMSQALARALAYRDIGRLPEATIQAHRLVGLLRDHGLLGDG